MSGKKTFNDLKRAEKEARKNLIIDAAERVFANKPYDKVSMKEIAKEAGISTSSIYTYFSDQETLFAEAFLRDTYILIESLTEITEKEQEPELKSIIDAFIDYFTDNEAYFRMMANFMLHGRLSVESLEKLNAVLRDILGTFDTFFKKRNNSHDMRLRSHILFAFLNGLLINFRKYPGRSEEEVTAHMKRLGAIFADSFER